MGWIAGTLALGCLAVGLLHLVRLAVLRSADEALHAAMGAGMAAMLSPLGNPVPTPVWVVVFLACGAGALLRHSEAGQHVVGAVSMLFMVVLPHAHTGAARTGPVAGLVSLAALVLAGCCAWHTLRCGDRWVARRPGAGAAAGRMFAPGTADGAHGAMAGAMAIMLLAMI